ncbi:MAG: calcium-binding outer rane-like protein [Acidobacteriaceae bacterium]|nr:calcium-binding outer rane-like protein [Acidobacteriaceae bacterium]
MISASHSPSGPAETTRSTHAHVAARAVSRKMKNALSAFICLASSSSAYAGTVTIVSPANGSMVNSPVHVHATYSSTVTATYMKLWVDHVAGTIQKNTNTFDTQIALTNGTHLLEVQASDPSTGLIYATAAQITVATLAVNPPSTSLPPGGMQQFAAADNASSSITWSATGGTVSSGGLYTAGSSTGTFAVTATDTRGNKTTAKMAIAPLHTVTIENPKNGSSLPSPVLVHATYNGTVIARYMKVWVDHVATLSQHNTNSFTTSLYLTSAAHLIEVQASDPSTGQVYTTATKITVTPSGGTITMSPASVILETGQTQQFTATDSGGLPVTWSATGGTVSGSGLYTAGTTTGIFSVTATDSNNNSASASVTIQSSTPNTVTIEIPANNSTVSSPVHVHATYNGTVTAS